MTWLFTQVWLWSLASFVLGSLLTWLLFVWPMKRRIKALTAEYVDKFGYVDSRENRFTRYEPGKQTEYGALDLLTPRDGEDTEPPTGTIDAVAVSSKQAEVEQTKPMGAVAVGHSDNAGRMPAGRPASAESLPGKTAEQQLAVSQPEGSEPAGQEPDGSEVSGEAQLSGQLRSLFEPVALSDGASAAVPYIPPAGGDTPRDVAGAVDGETPLLRREPGSGPSPGSCAESEPAAAAVAEQAEQASERQSYLIKGHFVSGRYHTPESPEYDRVTAEVWFRSAADAEEAGFEPWNARE